MALRLLDIGTESSLRRCIGKPCGGVRPLIVGHDNNVFSNGLAQQAIQKEIAHIKLLPENLCSYQRGKGCGDATIIGPQGTSIGRRSPRVSRIPYKSGQLFSHF
jgi:hypothetical protein